MSESLIAWLPGEKSAVFAITELLESGVPREDLHIDWRETQHCQITPARQGSVWQRIQRLLTSPPADHSGHAHRVRVTLFRSAVEPSSLQILLRHEAELQSAPARLQANDRSAESTI